jgi:chromosomal replication initiation ATPase DnaA
MSGGQRPQAPEQLVLALPHRAALGAEDFLVSEANRGAVAIIDRWPDWPHNVLALTGPVGAGKSHLANVWRLRSGADVLTAARLDDASIAARQPATPAVIEDVDRGLAEERVLFHLLNLAREHNFHVLVTARLPPGDWPIRLPDLRSRLRGAAVASIEPPDDALLSGVLVKLFADRQLGVEPSVVSYLVQRMERSMEAAQRIVAEIDTRALQTHRKVSRQLAAEVLGGRR